MDYKNLGVAGRIILLLIYAIAIGSMVYLGAFWSLGQTISFTVLSFPDNPLAGQVWGWFIQFSPNLLLVAAANSEQGGAMRKVWIYLALFFTAIDAGTNIGERRRIDHLIVNDTARYFGYLMAVISVAFEEGISIGISIAFDNIGKIIEGSGKRAPQWLKLTGNLAHAAVVGNKRRERRTPTENSRSATPRRQSRASQMPRPSRQTVYRSGDLLEDDNNS